MRNKTTKIIIGSIAAASTTFGVLKLIKFISFKKKESKSHLNTSEVYRDTQYQ